MAEPTTRTPTHYDILGVRPTASPQQIRRAFRDLSKLYHPDTTQLPPSEATDKFQQLNEAYAVLSNPDRRWTYDKQVGYSRISVMQPLEPLSRAQASPRRKEISNLYLDPNDRPLSAGEIFALFILGLTFIACLVLVLTMGFTRGDVALIPTRTELVEVPDPSLPQAQAVPPGPATVEKQSRQSPDYLQSSSATPQDEAITTQPAAPSPLQQQDNLPIQSPTGPVSPIQPTWL